MLAGFVLGVAFVGVGGHDAQAVDRQVAALLHHDAGVDAIRIAAKDRAALLAHDKRAEKIVRAIDADGVIAGGLTDKRGSTTLRIVVYAHDGHLAQMLDTPLDAHALTADDIDVLRSNLIPAVESLVAAAGGEPAGKAPPPPAPAEVADPFAEPGENGDGGGNGNGNGGGNGNSGGTGTGTETETETAADPDPATDTDADAVPDADADAVPDADADADAGPDPDADADAAAAAAADDDEPEPHLGLEAAIGAGVLARSFSPAPATITGYGSSAVPAVRFTAAATPVPRLALRVLAERTVSMSTDMGRDAAPTTVTRWEASAAYAVRRGWLDVAVVAGLGSRGFAIESTDPTRSPDSRYRHLIAGVTAAHTIGRVSIRAAASFLPVIGGAQPTAMAFGSARRWGLDLGVAGVIRFGRMFTEVAADYERFQWSWPAAGDRGAGGATDAFPSVAVAVGAQY